MKHVPQMSYKFLKTRKVSADKNITSSKQRGDCNLAQMNTLNKQNRHIPITVRFDWRPFHYNHIYLPSSSAMV